MSKAKLVALFLSFSLIIPLLFSFPMNTGANGTSLVYTAIGDSIAAGYRLPKYTSDGKTTEGAYVALFGDEIGATKINDKAISGSDTSDTLKLLDNSAYAAAISEADVITLSMGSNDLLGPGQKIIAEALGITGIGQLGAALTPDAIGGLKKISEYAKKDEQKARLSAAVESFKVNWVAMIDKIVELNPDATVVVSNYYNPYLPLSSLSPYGVDIDKTVDAYLGQMNEFITSHKYNGRLYAVADVTAVGTDKTNVNLVSKDMDPHPNAAGHVYIYEQMLSAYKTAIAKPNLPRPEQTTTLPFVTTELPCVTTTLPETSVTTAEITSDTTAEITSDTTAEITVQSLTDGTKEENRPTDLPINTETPQSSTQENKDSSCAGVAVRLSVAIFMLAIFGSAVTVIKKNG